MRVKIAAHVLQRPVQGTGFVGRYPVFNYTHRKIARGGDDYASCSIKCSQTAGEEIYSEYLGCIVQFYASDNPIDPIFEGFINRVTLRTGGVVLTRSLDEMSNRVSVVFYSANSGATPKTEITTAVNNTDSQDIYGIKEGTFDGGIHFNAADTTHKQILRDTIRTIRAWPQISVASTDRVEGTSIELEIRGLKSFAWEWQNYTSTNTTLETASDAFTRVTVLLTGAPPSNGALIYGTGNVGTPSLGEIAANTTFNISRESRSGQSYWQYIQSIIEAGDGSAQYTCGITRSNIFAANRYVYYRPAAVATLKYTTKAYKDAGMLRNTAGVLIPGHLIEPDAAIQVMDLLPNWSQPGDNPTIGYIESIDYDAESGRVKWQTGDNLTLEGVLQGTKYFKKSGVLFGAQTRQVL